MFSRNIKFQCFTWDEICFLNSSLCIIFWVPNIFSIFILFCCHTSFASLVFQDWLHLYLWFPLFYIFDFLCFSSVRLRSPSQFAAWTHSHFCKIKCSIEKTKVLFHTFSLLKLSYFNHQRKSKLNILTDTFPLVSTTSGLVFNAHFVSTLNPSIAPGLQLLALLPVLGSGEGSISFMWKGNEISFSGMAGIKSPLPFLQFALLGCEEHPDNFLKAGLAH